MNQYSAKTVKAVFFMSGFAALIYQIAWQRMLFTAFGVDLESITIIIAVFMAGLGIGAYFGGRIADNFILLLFPTFLMGSTLPLLTQYLNQHFDNIGNNIGWLYFTNTLGAAFACISVGFFLFNHLTITQVIYLAAIVNCLVATIIFIKYGRKG